MEKGEEKMKYNTIHVTYSILIEGKPEKIKEDKK